MSARQQQRRSKSSEPQEKVYTKAKDYLQLQLKSNQKPILNYFRSNQISILTGDPGTAKTTLALYYALQQLFEKQFERIVITKPLVECGASMGFLPGDVKEKTEVYLKSYMNTITKLVGKGECAKLFNGKKIVFEPIQFVRGDTYEHSCIIFDECQNSDLFEIMSVVTRIAESSQMILLGDEFQSDIKRSGLKAFLKISENVQGLGHMELGDDHQMRSKIIVDLYNSYKKFLKNGSN